MLLAGLDIGTTGCKVTVYRPDGECLGRVYRDYPLSRTASEHEVDAALIWQAALGVLSEAAAQFPHIESIGVTSFGETFVLLDEQDTPLCNAMLYTDPRGDAECHELCDRLGQETIADITGLNPHPMYSISKLMWIKRHRPTLFAKTARICLMADYIVYKLTGTAQIDYALASRSMAFDIRAMDWSNTLLSAAGIDRELLSQPVPIGSEAGGLSAELAARLGLDAAVRIVSAGHDQVAAAVGSGVFDETTAVDGAGTVECITPVFQGFPDMRRMTYGSYAVVPYVESDLYVCYAFSFAGGALIKWFVDNLAGYAASEAALSGIDIYQQLEGTQPLDRPTGLLALPHFAGAATPYMDAGSKGAIVGLTLASTQQEIFRGLMEGVCYEMRVNMERLNAAGIHFSGLRATGGGANSRVWMQMKADILNVPVTSLQSSESGGVGSAMMAGVAAGIFPNLQAAAGKMVRERETFVPRQEMHHQYEAIYQRYRNLYDAVRPLVT